MALDGTLSDDGVEVTIDAALDDWLGDAVAWANNDWRLFMRAAHLALLLTLLETLLDDLVELAEHLTGEVRPGRSNRSLSIIDRQLLFLRERCQMIIELTPTQRRDLDDLRIVRNKLVHTLGKDVPAEVRARLDELIPPDADEEMLKSDPFIDHCFRVVGEIAAILDASFEARFG